MLIESAGRNSVASRSTMRGPLSAKPRSRMARRLTGLAVQAATELRKPGWNCSVGAPPRGVLLQHDHAQAFAGDDATPY
jgi:hypothetical protein